MKRCVRSDGWRWLTSTIVVLLLLHSLAAQAQPASPPVISFIPDQGVFPNSTSRPIAFVIGDEQTPANLLSLSAVSANQALVPNSGIVFGGAGSNRTAVITPSLNQTGATTITITVTDTNSGAASNLFALDVAYFTPVASDLPVLGEASAAWGDYDNDGWLDLLFTGYYTNGVEAFVFRNTGGGFTNIGAAITGGVRGIASWADYNRDGRLDILLTGGIPKLYRNDGNGVFTLVNSGLPIIHDGYSSGAVAWGDIDNDGDSDLALSGQSTNLMPSTFVFRNNGDDTFSNVNAGLVGTAGGSLDWGDYDGDGDLDLLVTGRGAASSHHARIYRNDGPGGLVVVATNFPGVWMSNTRWADYDSDGDLDFLLTGSVGDYNPLSRVYRNAGGSFTDINAGLNGVWFGQSGWEDIDNDGRLDLALSGWGSSSTSLAFVYRNQGNHVFAEVAAGITNVYASALAWGDYDRDGDLDVLVTGYGCQWGCSTTQLYRNNAPSNAPPSAPTGLTSMVKTNGDVLLRWAPASDSTTPTAGLDYSLRVGTNSGGGQTVSPLADAATGWRRVAQPGLVHTNELRLIDLPGGTYYWSAQAVDSGRAGSVFAAEQTFTITNSAPRIQVVAEVRSGPSLPITLPFTVSDVESAASQLVATSFSTNSTFIPQASIVVQGTGADRTVSFNIAAGQYGSGELIIRVNDPGGLTREARVRVVSELFTALPIPANTNISTLTPLNIGWGFQVASPAVDLDQDGDLDVLFSARVWSNNFLLPALVIASNQGFGTFQFNIVTNVNLPLGAETVAFDDFNRDGKVDLISLYGGYDGSGVWLLPGDGVGGFTPGQSIGPGFVNFLADMDNDGDLDGLALADNPARLDYFKNVNGSLQPQPGPPLLSFTTYQENIAARASDLDGDGDVDFYIPGEGTNLSQRLVIRTLRNLGLGRFNAQMYAIMGSATVYSVRSFDGDDDRDPDAIFTYETNYAGPILRGMAASDGNGGFYFTTNIPVPSLYAGDFDNDGDLDRIVSELVSPSPYTVRYRLYDKTGPGQYAPQNFVISDAGFAADFDGDGDLDYLANTEERDENGLLVSARQWRFYRNNTDRSNAPPAAPSGLIATQQPDDRVRLSWTAALDDHTPAEFVTYNLRLGTTPGGVEIMSPGANLATGRRWLAAEGNVGNLTFRDVRSLPVGTYYWSVQAIDGGFAGSAWSPEQSFTINLPSISALPNVVTPPGVTSKPVNFTVTGGSSPLSALVITVVADDPTLIPNTGLVVTGTGANRTLTITPANFSGDTDLTVTATDLAGFSAIGRVHVRVSWWDARPLDQVGIQRFEQWRWLDSDLDGRLDLFGYAPIGTSMPQLFSYHNLGGAQFESVSNNLPGWTGDGFFVGGLGGDNVADVLTLQRPDSQTALFRLWLGTGAGFNFMPMPEVSNRAAVVSYKWVDLNNDGWRDVVHFGWVTPAPSNAPPWAMLFARGKPDGTFEYLANRIGMYSGTAIVAADFDLDGDFDLAVSGQDYASGQNPGAVFSRLYRNDGSFNFTPVTAGLPQGVAFNLSVADVDQDGWPDLLLNPASPTSTNHPVLMRNVGGSFVAVASDLPTQLDLASWADIDNDGDPDLVSVTSVDLSVLSFDASGARVFRNEGGVLTLADLGLPAIAAHQASFADADNDGDLDLLISGETGWNVTGRYLCLNSSPRSNTPPAAPTGLSLSFLTNRVMLQWTPTPDAESGTALTYNLRLGTTPGGSEIMSAAANPITGLRQTTGDGNIGYAPRWRFDPPDGRYYWTVQAVDSGFAASPFAVESSFSYFHPTISGPTNIVAYAGSPSALISLVVGDADSLAGTLTLAAFSSNPGLLDATNVVFGGSDSNRTATITLPPGSVGASVVNVVVTDITGLSATNTFTFTADYFSQLPLSLPGGGNGTPSVADIDGDGDLDLYLAGKIYRNDGGTNFVLVSSVLAGQRHGVVWADYDRDGDLDLAVAGGGPTKIYRNDGVGVFTDSGAVIPDAGSGAIAWGDYDNDGDLDLFSLGNGLIYRNDGTSGFVGVSVGLPGVGESSVAWGDFDNDGYQDILLAGFQGPSTTVGGIYRNNGNGTFSNIGAAIPGFHGASVSWGDYDNDGYLDVLVCGVWSTFQVYVYHNNRDGTFTDINLGLPGVAYGYAQWVDFDNDGLLDIFLCGNVSNYPNLDYASHLYRNRGDGTFSDPQSQLPKGSTATWGDLDGDADLDLIVSGDGSSSPRLLQNECPAPNAPPAAPTNLVATLLPDNNVILSWLPVSDLGNTNPASLSYALRAGTTPGGVDYLSPHANGVNGYRRLPQRGPYNTSTNFFRDVSKGSYHWSVQAIDAGFAGSAFATEISFSITNARPLISAISNQLTVPGRATSAISFTISDLETDATNLTLTKLSFNPALVPAANIVFGGSGSNRTVTVTPVAGQSGTAAIVVGVMDGGGLVATSRFDVLVQNFTEVSVGLPGNASVPTAWGDYDNDGDLDVATINGAFTTVYRNTGGFFTNQNFTLPAAVQYITPTDLTWLDLDGDGDLDLAESGWILSGYQTVTFRFRNNFPANSFTSIGTNLPGTGVTNVADGAMAWADYDNDGDLDVLLSGDTNTYHTPDAFAALYRNDRGVFTNSGVVLPQLVKSAAVWGDYDNDGDLDLLIAGQTGSVAANSVTKLFRNDGNGVFTEVPVPFPGITDCALAFGDFDNDGDLDFVMAGQGTNAAPLTRIYRNLGNGVFTNLAANFTGVTYASVAWGDYDNDGFADLAVSGATNNSPYGAAAAITSVYRNYGGNGFTNSGGTLPGVMMQNTSWGDADNDGDLDLLVGARLVRNNWNVTNTAPTAPTNLSFAFLATGDVRLAWTRATDVQTTNASGLRYNLRIGTNAGGGQILAPHANSTNGYHRVPDFGNAGATNFWRIANLTNATYYWSVQAIDGGLAGSAFAAEQTFTLSRPVFSVITNRSAPPNTVIGPISFTVSDGETPASNLVVTVTSSDTNLVPNADLVLAGADTNRNLTITPVTNRSGSVTITLAAVDESGQVGSRSFLLTLERFADLAAGLSGSVGPVVWGDFDNDGDLDLVKGNLAYRNLGGGVFSNLAVNLPYNEGFGGWDDFNRDGNLDLLLVGANACKVYRTDGNGNFTDSNAGLPAAITVRQTGDWGDFDNDGDPDLALATVSFTRIYRNNGTNFTDINAGLPAAGDGSVAWGDFDQDGDLDLLLAGNNSLRVYRNNGNGTFSDLGLNLPGVYNASVGWGDFDNDGWPDFAVCGSTNNAVIGVVTRIYRNTLLPTAGSRQFTNFIPVAAQGPVGVWKGVVAWADYDNDGDLDLLTTGETTNSFPRTRIYRNDNGAFVDSGANLPGLKNSFAAWGDFDNDGYLDLALSGNDFASAPVARIYRNFPGGSPNVPPNSPTGLTNVVSGKSARLTWTAATDANQPAGLSYNLRVGTAPGTGDIVSPLAGATGGRKIPAPGNANERLTWTFTNLTGGTFYWSVQAVDHSLAGSAFATERSFVISNRAPVAVTKSVTLSEDASLGVTLTGSDPDNDPLTFKVASAPLFGNLSGNPPLLTYQPATNYFGFDQFTYQANDRTTDSVPAAVFITVTPVEDVGASSLSIAPAVGGQYQLGLTGEPWRSYRLEASEDLIHWQPLTSLLATNLLTLLMDADAPNFPHRFYRAAQFEAVPEIGNAQLNGSNQFQFTLSGEVGRLYQLQASSDLQSWTTLTNVLMTNVSTPFLGEGTAIFPQRFYRIVAP